MFFIFTEVCNKDVENVDIIASLTTAIGFKRGLSDDAQEIPLLDLSATEPMLEEIVPQGTTYSCSCNVNTLTAEDVRRHPCRGTCRPLRTMYDVARCRRSPRQRNGTAVNALSIEKSDIFICVSENCMTKFSKCTLKMCVIVIAFHCTYKKIRKKLASFKEFGIFLLYLMHFFILDYCIYCLFEDNLSYVFDVLVSEHKLVIFLKANFNKELCFRLMDKIFSTVLQ